MKYDHSSLLRPAALAVLFLCSACAGVKDWEPNATKERRTFFYPGRQNAPEPVYNRVRIVNPPEVLPERNVEFANAPKVFPVVHLELKNVTLEETAQTLAATSRYRAYCSGLIANKKFTVDSLGTIDELAETIASKADISVVVDHEHGEVRFFGKTPAQPELYRKEVVSKEEKRDDHKSYY